MKIIFLRDTLPIVQTGNEFYRAGVDADLRDGDALWLIDQGYARSTESAAPAPVETPQPEPPVEAMPDYAGLTVAELRELANEAGIAAGGKRKAELIAALEEAWPNQ